jgi:acyl-CoA hydrolase
MYQGHATLPLRTPVFYEFLDTNGYVKAGHVLKLIDIKGSESALRYLNQDEFKGLVVTASLDRTDFREPIRVFDVIHLESQVTQVWKTSMEVQVRVRADNMITGECRDIATSYLVFVAIDGKTRQKIHFPPYHPNSPEEVQLAKAADLRKKNRQEEGRTAPFIPIEDADNPVIVTRLMTPNDANAQSNVFGGEILALTDNAGSQAAKSQALSGTVVGVAQDRMSFIGPTFIGETAEARAIVTKTWNTSMEVQVEVDAIHPNSGLRRKVASSYLVYVRLGPDNRPAEVPPLFPQTEAQEQRAERAEVRQSIRKHEEAQAKALDSAHEHHSEHGDAP